MRRMTIAATGVSQKTTAKDRRKTEQVIDSKFLEAFAQTDPSGRAKCQECQKTIPKESVRVAGKKGFWHVACFPHPDLVTVSDELKSDYKTALKDADKGKSKKPSHGKLELSNTLTAKCASKNCLYKDKAIEQLIRVSVWKGLFPDHFHVECWEAVNGPIKVPPELQADYDALKAESDQSSENEDDDAATNDGLENNTSLSEDDVFTNIPATIVPVPNTIVQQQNIAVAAIELGHFEWTSNGFGDGAPKIIGLANGKNICFIGAVLQCFIRIPQFVRLVSALKQQHQCPRVSGDRCAICALGTVFSKFWTTSGSLTDAFELHEHLNNVGRNAPIGRRSNFAQEDAENYISFILDELTYLPPNAGNGLLVQSANVESALRRIFHPGVTAKSQCIRCSEAMQSIDEGNYLKIAVHTVKTLLSAVVGNCFSAETMETSKCGKCKGYLQRIPAVGNAPEILVFQFLLFHNVGTIENPKIKKMPNLIEIPTVLEFLAKFYDGAKFQLLGIVFHQGATIGSGHYTSLVDVSVSGPPDFYHFNDGVVKPLRYAMLPPLTDAYLVFFRKVQAPTVPKQPFQEFCDQIRSLANVLPSQVRQSVPAVAARKSGKNVKFNVEYPAKNDNLPVDKPAIATRQYNLRPRSSLVNKNAQNLVHRSNQDSSDLSEQSDVENTGVNSSSKESDAEQELVQAGGDVSTYTRKELEAIGEELGGYHELNVFANFYNYPIDASRKTPDLIEFLIGKARLMYKDARTANKDARRKRKNELKLKRNRTKKVRHPKRILDDDVERTKQSDKPEVKHPIWYDQFVDAIVEHPSVETVDGQEVRSPNWNRIAPLFLDVAYKTKVEALTPIQLHRFMELAGQVHAYISNNFERDDFYGFEGGKWNILGWMTCILGVAQSDTTTGCWIWKGSLKGGRPRITSMDCGDIPVSNLMVCLNPASEPTTSEIGRERMKFSISHLCHNPKCVRPSCLHRESLEYNQSRIYCKIFCIKFCQHAPKCQPKSADGYDVPCCKHEDGNCPRICDCADA